MTSYPMTNHAKFQYLLVKNQTTKLIFTVNFCVLSKKSDIFNP